MKTTIILAMGLVAILLNACQPAKTDDPELLKKTLTAYFEGIENKDTAKMIAVTTDDFLLYENGLLWNNDSAFMNIRRNMPFTVKYTFSNFKIYVDNTSGDMTYFNHADFVFKNDQKFSLDWIESATFRKVGGVWKMNFLNATVSR
jgi:hypothetical protein